MNYVIRNNDGDTYVEELTDEQLESRMAEGYYGETNGMSRMPKVRDTDYWGESILIIRGEIITGGKK